ncbi:MAG: tRNA (N(6)-L-threonylcarbamoyladenosine(37)-C(2))-methylthiotransferase MtaB [Lachnospiraceae bacterium]|nr:tRNA (N(6)-L-threonylcarbamoyladenosine(37)-C(2))-methylthiotransferase MtaB [Lachnospiraceae bacterium]MDD7078954.1 tRNA (N(6)-L-threonylcarbamoyladenosine(37)-C(2))-methylthiotransferase MtaB [Lachnospiraceae bacterium]MDY3730303.1 tRNA (N(6)-L-threonylcarbamoyladenosine(37)-C(2))-methylthiotransferase MtaB [Candidatus Choladocola sp.]
MKKKAALHNLGCKVNAYETEAMGQLLENAGYEIVPFEPGADVYVINTCTVTNIADRKSRQMLHKARKMNPQAIVVATGCYVQTAQEPVEDDPAIDIVLGNNCKKDLIEAIRYFEEMRQPALPEKIDINKTKEYENFFVPKMQDHTRAHIKVQDGCNQFCSYCIIPYARGRVRSRAMEDVIKEATALAGNGCREVVLTGIHLSSYGVDQGTSLLELIRAVHQVEGICRIRLGSLEPGIITEEFAEALGELPKLCPHFHLSLQSGCTSTLKRMNRRYTAEEFEEKCRILRQVFDRPAITTDVIAGFPGETEEEFETTYDFLSRIRLYETHIFKYSRRHGTRAASMPDQVPEQVKGQRSDRLIALGEKNRRLFEQQYAGELTEVLFEEKTVIEGKEYYTGYNKQYIKLAVPADGDYENVLIQGRIAKEVAPHLFLLEQEKY